MQLAGSVIVEYVCNVCPCTYRNLGSSKLIAKLVVGRVVGTTECERTDEPSSWMFDQIQPQSVFWPAVQLVGNAQKLGLAQCKFVKLPNQNVTENDLAPTKPRSLHLAPKRSR